MDPTRYFPGLSAGFGPRTIFLDIDGVLNTDEICEESGRSHSHPLFSPQQHLSTELVTAVHEVVQSTDAQVVISSTWRRTYDVRCLRAFLWGCGFRETDRIVGVTPRLKGLPRSEEIAAWLRDCGPSRPKSFAIVDDDPGACPREYARERFVECNPFVGFDTAASLRCTALLLAELEMTKGSLVTILFVDADPKRPQLMLSLGGAVNITTAGIVRENLSYTRVSMRRASEPSQAGKAKLNFSCDMVVHWEPELGMTQAAMGDLILLRFREGKSDQPSPTVCIKSPRVITPHGVRHESTAYTPISLAEASDMNGAFDSVPWLNISTSMVILWSKDE